MQDTLNFAKNYWFLIVTIGTIVGTWATIQLRVEALETKLGNLEVKQSASEGSLVKIEVELAKINTNLEYIKRAVK